MRTESVMTDVLLPVLIKASRHCLQTGYESSLGVCFVQINVSGVSPLGIWKLLRVSLSSLKDLPSEPLLDGFSPGLGLSAGGVSLIIELTVMWLESTSQKTCSLYLRWNGSLLCFWDRGSKTVWFGNACTD